MCLFLFKMLTSEVFICVLKILSLKALYIGLMLLTMFAPFRVFMILDTTIWYYFSLDESFFSCEPEGILKMFLNFQQSCAIFSYKLGSYKTKAYCTMPLIVILVNFLSVAYNVQYNYLHQYLNNLLLV